MNTFTTRHGFTVSCRTNPNPDGTICATLRAINPTNGHLLRYRDMDLLLKTRSRSPNAYVQISASAPTEEGALAAVKARESKLFLLCQRYEQAVYRSGGSEQTAAAFWQLYREDYGQWANLTDATRKSQIRDIEYHVLPALAPYPLHRLSAEEYHKAEQTLTRSTKQAPRSAARKNELLRRLRSFVCFANMQDCCALNPEQMQVLACNEKSDNQHISRLITANARPAGLSDEERARLLRHARTAPDTATALAICLTYDGLSPEDMTLLRFGDLHLARSGGNVILTATIPDTGKDTQPVAKVRRVPLSPATLHCIQSRFCYWQQLGCAASELALVPLISSRRKHAAAYSAEKINALLLAALIDIAKVAPGSMTRSYYKKDGSRSAHRKAVPVTTKQLLDDAKNILRNQIGLSCEQADAILGIAQKTTDGRHYYDLYSDDSMVVIYKKRLRFAALSASRGDLSPHTTAYTPGSILQLAQPATCNFRCSVAAKTPLTIRSDTSVQLSLCPRSEGGARQDGK